MYINFNRYGDTFSSYYRLFAINCKSDIENQDK